MAKFQTHEHVLLELIDSAFKTAKTTPLNLGGLSGGGGGLGQPPGGYIGQLPQVRVAYDETEAATLFTPASGMSLLDNLNHIRYRIESLESGSGVLNVEQYGGVPSVSLVEKIIFSGALVEDLGGGTVLVSISGGGGGPAFEGDPMEVVLTDADGNLYTPGWLKHGGSPGGQYVEFGADVAGKESNAGKMGYETFGAGFLFIVGAGTAAPRKVKIFDDLVVDNDMTVNNGLQSSTMNITNPSATYNIDGVAHTHTTHVIDTIMNKAPRGWMWNGKIAPSVASNDLTLALKTWAGSDPSSSDPVIVRIGDTVRTITSSLSVTLNDGTNWFNSGAAETATKEIDYFAYLVWDSNSSVVALSFSRVPYGLTATEFSSTTTNEKHLVGHSGFTATDELEVVGRFAATLSAGGGFTWTVPTYTNANLVQRPIYETRVLDFVSTKSVNAGSMSSVSVTHEKYQVIGKRFFIDQNFGWTQNTSNADYVQTTQPFTFGITVGFGGVCTPGSAPVTSNVTSSGNSIFVRQYNAATAFTVGSGKAISHSFFASL